MTAFRWSLPHHVHVAMSRAVDGDLRTETRRSAWSLSLGVPDAATVRQVHGDRILPIAAAGQDGDGLVSTHQAIGVYGADCPSLVIATPHAIGAAHCGWRGTARGIVARLAEALDAAGAGPRQNWTALVGPGVHPDDYEVDAAVLTARDWPPGTWRTGRPGHAWLDLPAAVAADCSAAGIAAVARTPLTTSRSTALRSHRRDGPGFPQLLVAWRDPACVG